MLPCLLFRSSDVIQSFAAVWLLNPPVKPGRMAGPRWKVIARCASVGEACDALQFWLDSYPRPEVIGPSFVAGVDGNVNALKLYGWLRNRLREPEWTGIDIKTIRVSFALDERGVFSEEL